jgi:WXXGXW repeat (2 copies)
MRENKFNIDGLEFRSSEKRNIFTEFSHAGAEGFAPASLKTGWTRRSMVTCLLGSLLLMLATMAAPTKASASVGIFVSFGPPAIPVYVQPACPAPGYIWTPGYWAWDPDYGYYWVPGTWVMAPFIGALWTPGYWGWYNSGYMWYPGYWGTAVGFYGGINYGYGYYGHGYYGGYWRGSRFWYNREVNHITNINIVNVYRQRVVEREGPRISYNGGRGGIDARPTSVELAAARTRRFGADNRQMEQERWARSNRSQWASENRGRPEVAATPRPGEFRGNGAVRATRAGAPYNEPAREVRRSPEPSRQAPAQVERRPQSNAPRQATPNQRMERSAPAQPTPNRQMERSAPPPQRNERQVNRNNQQNTVQRSSPQARPQPQAQRPEGRATPERQAHPPNQGKQEGGRDHNPGHGKR